MSMQSLDAMNHRGFLAQCLCLIAAGTVSRPALRARAAALESASALEDAARADGGAVLSATQWKMVSAVQAHLLPSEPGKPGAREVHAEGVLRLVLADPRLDPEDRQIVLAGAAEFETLCQERFGKPFPALGAEARERALREFEARPSGEQWLGEMLDFLLEALLGDPSYGGNPDGIAWKWLGIDPGFPLPPVNKGSDPEGGDGAQDVDDLDGVRDPQIVKVAARTRAPR